MATHSCFSAWNNSRTFSGAFTLPRTRVSNSFQVCLFRFKSGDVEDQERILDVVVGEELCDAAWCTGSGIVVVKYSAKECLMREKKKPKTKNKKISGFFVCCWFFFQHYKCWNQAQIVEYSTCPRSSTWWSNRKFMRKEMGLSNPTWSPLSTHRKGSSGHGKVVLCELVGACGQTTVNKKAPIHSRISMNDMVYRPL